MNNKPLLLRPSGKNYIWGGKRLNDEFEKNIDLYPLAETWECSTHPDGPCYIENGSFKGETLNDFIKKNPDALGIKHSDKDYLPILIKFIDANKDLSLQVHPSDEYAMKYENGQLGKTEMWYILDAKKDSKIIYGLKRDSTPIEITKKIKNDTILNLVQKINVKKNDVFLINSGTIHAIGTGILLVEVQENSNLTYRLYDYNREDKNGKKRELHIKKALKVSNLSCSPKPKQHIRVINYERGLSYELLCRCKYFETYKLILNTERKQIVMYKNDNFSFRVLLCIKGSGIIKFNDEEIFYYKGDCIFIPANCLDLRLYGNTQFLEIRG